MHEVITGEQIDAAEFTLRMGELVPLTKQLGIITTDFQDDGRATAYLGYDEKFVRPGGSISGPAIMALADVAMMAGITGKLGWTPMAMTSNLSTTFLSPPKLEGLIAETTALRFGRRLAFFSVTICSESDPATPVAHVTGTYAIPQAR
jgi:uncharacterized protein (TIGR00369 family)